MKKKHYFFYIVLVTLTSLISCKDDDNINNGIDANFSNRSLIKSITRNSFTTYNPKHIFLLSYDSNGNLESMTCKSLTDESQEIKYENYSWTQDSIKVRYYTSENDDLGTENYSRNTKGYVASGEFSYLLYWGLRTQQYDCNYNHKNQLTDIFTSLTHPDENFLTEHTEFTWENDNIVLINKSNYLIELEYYTDTLEKRDLGLKYLSPNSAYHTMIPGNTFSNYYKSLRSDLYGQNPMFLSKNLLKKYFDGYKTIEYTYEFDSKDRVISQTQITKKTESEIIQKMVFIYEYFD